MTLDRFMAWQGARAGSKVETGIGARKVLELDPPGLLVETAAFLEGLDGRG